MFMMIGARLMLDDRHNTRREFAIPRAVMQEAYGSSVARARYAESVSRVRTFCGQVGLMGRVGTRAWSLSTRYL